MSQQHHIPWNRVHVFASAVQRRVFSLASTALSRRAPAEARSQRLERMVGVAKPPRYRQRLYELSIQLLSQAPRKVFAAIGFAQQLDILVQSTFVQGHILRIARREENL